MLNKKILGIGFTHRTELQYIEPIIQHLRRHCDARILLPEMLQTTRFFDRIFEEALTQSLQESIKKNKPDFEKILSFLKEGPLPTELCEWKGLDLSSPFHRYFPKKKIAAQFSLAWQYYQFVLGALEHDKPDTVILPGTLSSLHKLCCLLCKKMGIRIVVIPHYLSQMSKFLAFSTSCSKLVDAWSALGNHTKRMLIQSGATADKVHITGLPGFSNQYPKTTYQKNDLFRKLDVFNDSFDKFFLLTLQGLPEDMFLIQAITHVMTCMPRYLLLIRPHPLTRDRLLHQWARRRRSRNVILSRDLNFDDLLYPVDLVMTFSSSTALQAIALRKPVMILNLTSRPEIFNFGESHAVRKVNQIKDIAPAIHEILKNPETIMNMKKGCEDLIASVTHPLEKIADLCLS